MTVQKIIEQKITENLEIDNATLLTIEEATQLSEELKNYIDLWWLRSPGYFSDCGAYVGICGFIDRYGCNVSYDCVLTRPALKISNLQSSNFQVGDRFEFGGKPFQIISNSLAFCLTDIGNHCFREDLRAKDVTDYEKSDIKKYVDEWFNDFCFRGERNKK